MIGFPNEGASLSFTFLGIMLLNTFSEKQLKEMTLEQLYAGLKNRSGKGKVNADIKPTTSIPFMIVFDNLPENMSEFTVEAVSSSPVK